MTPDISITELRATRSPEATLLALGAILLATSLAAGLGALVSGGEADPWYAALNKAPGTPPGFLAVGTQRLRRHRRPGRGRAVAR